MAVTDRACLHSARLYILWRQQNQNQIIHLGDVFDIYCRGKQAILPFRNIHFQNPYRIQMRYELKSASFRIKYFSMQ